MKHRWKFWFFLALGYLSVGKKFMDFEDSRNEHRRFLLIMASPNLSPRAVTEPSPKVAAPSDYTEVVEKNVFSEDRNPYLRVDPPKTPEAPIMPNFPIVFGVMALPSGIKALMAEKRGDVGAPVKSGEAVGEFKVLALDMKKVTFEWKSKQITKNIDDLIDRTGKQSSALGPSATARNPPPQPDSSPSKSLGPIASNPLDPSKGIESGISAPAKACDDTSPAGTVVDGHKKVYIPTPFGLSCRWVQ